MQSVQVRSAERSAETFTDCPRQWQPASVDYRLQIAHSRRILPSRLAFRSRFMLQKIKRDEWEKAINDNNPLLNVETLTVLLLIEGFKSDLFALVFSKCWQMCFLYPKKKYQASCFSLLSNTPKVHLYNTIPWGDAPIRIFEASYDHNSSICKEDSSQPTSW